LDNSTFGQQLDNSTFG